MVSTGEPFQFQQGFLAGDQQFGMGGQGNIIEIVVFRVRAFDMMWFCFDLGADEWHEGGIYMLIQRKQFLYPGIIQYTV